MVQSAVLKAAQLSGTARALKDKVLPKFVDLLGWCTWDAFYSKVCGKALVRGVEEQRRAGVQPGFVVLDDGWQRVATDDEYEAQTKRQQETVVRVEGDPQPKGWRWFLLLPFGWR